ncbi:SDR family NAD(P)-dependent oxidoreductase [Crateriforma conspicua]|uniref:Glucose 1-dehydrogenase 4 n=1 Tax=Crateriforma conspicua TaxID=2527996 RepID=A0A5C5Y978_9PLAN|nr:SDR family oxidoreductase [Crateriforma conspicua]TWT71910.1 Glucose 1-dehydrogenase 4 [Crateriforma conspicua]
MISLQSVFETDSPVVLVTGSGSPRVGRGIASWFADCGCHIAIHANQSVAQAAEAAEDLSDKHGIETAVVQGSLEDDTTPRQMVDAVVSRWGRIDVLINSAAIWSPTKLEDVTPAEVRRYFQVNSVGTFETARVAGLQMAAQTAGGAIINIGDWATCRPYLDHAAYFPSKGAIETMTRSLAVEFGRRNTRVRVNAILPGPVLLADDVSDQVRQSLVDSTLVGRVGTPDDVAHAAMMLCQNTFITGVCLPVDGGKTVFANDGLQTGYNTG